MFPTVPVPPNRLLVFARLPEPGRVKARLASALGEERALELYRAMLQDVVGNVGSSTAETAVEFLWHPTPAANARLLRESFGEHETSTQAGTTLGDRLSMAFSERFFFHRTRKIVAIGSDDPTITRETLDRVFELLDSCEYVLGPAADGGYYLIGCRALSFDPSIFEAIDWGTPSVLETTLRRIATLGRTVALLPCRFDIDTVEDLERYTREGHTGALATALRSAE